MFIKILLFCILLITTLFILDKRKRRQIINKYKSNEDMRGQMVEIDNIKIYCIEAGNGEPLVIIHGFMSSSIDFTEVMDELSKHYRIIAADLIGFGKSDKRENLNYSKKNMAVIIHKLMESKGINRYNVLGHSMGGGVSLNLAHYYPDNVKALVLVDSVGYSKPKRPPVPPFVIEHIIKSYYVQKLFFRICLKNIRNSYLSEFERLYNLNCAIPCKCMYKFSRGDDRETIEGTFDGIKCPTLIIWGSHDRVTPIENAYRFKKDIKNSKVEIFENSGHMPYLEERGKFIKVVQEFLQLL